MRVSARLRQHEAQGDRWIESSKGLRVGGKVHTIVSFRKRHLKASLLPHSPWAHLCVWERKYMCERVMLVCYLVGGWHTVMTEHPISNTQRRMSSQMHTSVDGKPLFHAGCGTRRLPGLCDKPFRAADSKHASV